MTVVTTTFPSKGNVLLDWAAMLDGSVPKAGDAASTGTYEKLTVQVVGTFGTGGSITMQGSNDGTNWATLEDRENNAITVTAAALVEIRDHPRFIRPNLTAGDGTTNLRVLVFGSTER